METKSYEYNGKRYDFVLSLRAKLEIEKLQKASQAGIAGNPEVVAAGMKVQRLQGHIDALGKSMDSLVDAETKTVSGAKLDAFNKLASERNALSSELEDAQAAVIPYMDSLSGASDTDPLEIGFIVASNYGTQRGEMTRDVFDALVDDMDMKIGTEETYKFFVEVQDMVFTQLNAMEAMKQAKDQAREETRKFLSQK